jgi:transcription elongation factor GreA
MQRVPMTPEGYEAMAIELRNQKEVVRPQVVRDIEEARAHGDISENSEYEDAKHRQALCEARIRELEGKLAAAEVIDIRKVPKSDRVIFGVTVVLEESGSEEESRYRIVGTDEADVKKGQISVTSPLGRALVGKSEGEVVTVQAPGGVKRYTIMEVLYE